MGEDPGTAGAPVAAQEDPATAPPAAQEVPAAAEAPKDPAQIQEEIEATRRELGDTVEALAAKADFKAHARERLERAKASLPNPAVLGAVAAVVVVGLVLVVRRRRR